MKPDSALIHHQARLPRMMPLATMTTNVRIAKTTTFTSLRRKEAA